MKNYVIIVLLNVITLSLCGLALADSTKATMKSPDGLYTAVGTTGSYSDSKSKLRVVRTSDGKVVFEHKDSENFYIKPIGFVSSRHFVYETCKNRCNEYSETNTYYTVVDTNSWKSVAEITPGLYPNISIAKDVADRLYITSESEHGKNFQVYDAGTGTLITNFNLGPARESIISDDGKRAVVLPKRSASAKLVNLENGSVSSVFLEDPPGNASFSPQGTAVVFGFSGKAAVYDLASGRQLNKYVADRVENCIGNCKDNLGAGSLVFSKSGKLLMAASESGVVYLWNVESGERLWTLRLSSKERNLLNNQYLMDSGKIPHHARFSEDEKEVFVGFGRYTKGFSLVDGTELGELQSEKRLALTKLAKKFEPKLKELGISKRFGFKSGDIRERYVPPVTNTHYNTETLYYIGTTPVTKTSSSTYTQGGYKEKVSGFTVVYEFKNGSSNNYIVDILLDGTVKDSNWKSYNPWFGDNFRSKSTVYEHLTVSKKILLKAGMSLKDQIVVGEEAPTPFTVGVTGVTLVDAAWISGLDRALEAHINNKKMAQSVLPLLEKYLADPLAAPWQEKLKANKQAADNILSAIAQVELKKLVSVSMQTHDDYDPDFDNEVIVTARNLGGSKCRITLALPDNQSLFLEVSPKNSANKKVSIKNVPKNRLKAVVERIDLL